jgi:hypothetical protein
MPLDEEVDHLPVPEGDVPRTDTALLAQTVPGSGLGIHLDPRNRVSSLMTEAMSRRIEPSHSVMGFPFSYCWNHFIR